EQQAPRGLVRREGRQGRERVVAVQAVGGRVQRGGLAREVGGEQLGGHGTPSSGAGIEPPILSPADRRRRPPRRAPAPTMAILTGPRPRTGGDPGEPRRKAAIGWWP